MSEKKGKKKKRRIRIRWKNVLLALAALALVIYLLISLVGWIGKLFEKDTNTFSSNGMTAAKLRTVLKDKQYAGAYSITDYVYYGQYLSFYDSAYKVGNESAVAGHKMILKDLASDKVIEIDRAAGGLDGQIDTSDLLPGFYEVYVSENSLEKRMYNPQKFMPRTFTTITKAGKQYDVTIYADSSMFNKADAEKDFLDRNYIFISVEERKAEAGTVYDVVLNPGPLVLGEFYDSTGNGISEMEQCYLLARSVKSILETEGYHVLIAHDDFDIPALYGDEGIAGVSYKSGGKIFITFDMYELDNGRGVSVTHSSRVSDTLAKGVYNALTKEAGMASLLGDDSVMSSSRENEYDMDYDIRETGGRALGAGVIEQFKVNFAEKNSIGVAANGLESIYIQMCNVASKDDVQYWTEHFDDIAKALAKGIGEYLKQENP